MTEPQTDTSISALIARPSEDLSARDISTLQASILAGAAALAEADEYAAAARVGLSDPVKAHGMLLAMTDDPDRELAWPMVRVALLAGYAARMDAIVDTVDFAARAEAGGPSDRAREAAFRRDPGRFLPGATKSDVVALPRTGFGVVRYEGRDLLWTYAAAGYAMSDLKELEEAVIGANWPGGLLVGPPAVESEVTLLEGIRFVAVDLGNTGSAA